MDNIEQKLIQEGFFRESLLTDKDILNFRRFAKGKIDIDDSVNKSILTLINWIRGSSEGCNKNVNNINMCLMYNVLKDDFPYSGVAYRGTHKKNQNVKEFLASYNTEKEVACSFEVKGQKTVEAVHLNKEFNLTELISKIYERVENDYISAKLKEFLYVNRILVDESFYSKPVRMQLF